MIKSSNKAIILCAILAVVFCSGHAFQTIFPVLSRLVLPVAAVFLMLELIRLKNLKCDRMQIVLLLFGLMVCLTCASQLGRGASFYIITGCYILAGYGLARAYSFRTIARCYVRIMTVVTAIAIIGYLLVQYTTVLDMLPEFTNGNDVTYKVAGIFNYIPVTSHRNCGMFWEPGLFATHLTIAMAFEIMLNERPKLWRLLLFAAGIVTANSAAGFALLFFCVILLLVKKSDFSQSAGIAVVGIIVLLLGIAVILNFDWILDNTVFGENEFLRKLSTDSVAESSRMNAIKHNWSMFLTAPIFGAGIIKVSAGMKHVADTSTSTYLLSVFGLLGALYTICWGYFIAKLPKVNVLAKLLLLVIILVIVNKEPHHQNLMTWCILFALIRGDFSERPQEETARRTTKFVVKWR